jgi:hypothetical protein
MANYLYNGVELPEIPEVAGYQYLMIFKFDTGYALYAYKENKNAGAPFYRRTSPAHEESFYFPGTYKFFSLRDGIWVQTVSKTSDSQHSVYSDRYKNPIWTNFTFKYTTVSTKETLVLCEASEPVPLPEIDHTAMVQGWIVGKRLAAMRGKKQPTAFLYNGVRLPAMPNRDTAKLPYALIWLNTLGRYTLYFTDVAATRNSVGNFVYTIPKIVTYSYIPGNAGWKYEEFESWEDGAWTDVGIDNTSTVIWANFNVLNEDGTLSLAASPDPVPVYD